jgi:hypothetical protein
MRLKILNSNIEIRNDIEPALFTAEFAKIAELITIITNISQFTMMLLTRDVREDRSAKISVAYFCFWAKSIVKIRSLRSLIFTLQLSRGEKC